MREYTNKDNIQKCVFCEALCVSEGVDPASVPGDDINVSGTLIGKAAICDNCLFALMDAMSTAVAEVPQRSEASEAPDGQSEQEEAATSKKGNDKKG